MLSQQVAQAARRATELRDRANVEARSSRLADVVEELHRALAELEIANEALRKLGVTLAERTAERDAERQRRERLFMLSPVACIMTDAGGAITRVNAAGMAMLGHDAESMRDVPLMMFVTLEQRARLEALAELEDADEAEDVFTFYRACEGERFSCRTLVLADSTGSRTWLLEDLTATEAATLADRLGAELRRRDEFLRALGHELRNPLAPVRSAVELWRDHGDELTPAQRTWTMEVVSRSADHLAHLVDDLLDVSRLAHGKIHLGPTRVDLRDVLESAYEAMRSRAQLHEVAFMTPAAPVWVVGDATRLRQVVANLLDNALKYTPKGRRIILRCSTESAQALLSVRDEGVGIEPERLEVIFGMFAQAESSLTRNPGRLGLGLALVRRLVELHRGTVQAHSDGVGRGSEFLVRLPLATEVDAGPLPATESQIMRIGRRRLLVVDDNVDAAEMLTMLLEGEGHEVTLAFDAASAIAAFERRSPDVVLLDIGLPDMDGLELARRLHARDADVPLVALTGYGDESMRARTRECGFAEHLLKPVDFEHLRRVLFEVGRRAGQGG